MGFMHRSLGLCLLGVSAVGFAAEAIGPPETPAASISPVTISTMRDNSSAPSSGDPIANLATGPAGDATNPPTQLDVITVTAKLDAAREEIAPSLGAVTYTIGANQIQSMSQGDNSSFQQVILHAPGVVQEEFGEVHVRGDHGDVQYRINGVLLPESLNGFGQELDPHVINSVTLITGTLPAQFGDRTAGIIDVTTKTASQRDDDALSLYGGSYSTRDLSGSVGGTKNDLDYFVDATYLHDNHGIDNTTSSSNPLHDVTDQGRVFGFLSLPYDANSRLTLLLSASYADFAIPNTPGLPPVYQLQLTGSPAANSSAINDSQNEQNYYVVLSYQKSVDDVSAQISAFTRYTALRFRPDPAQDLLFTGNAAQVENSDLANGLQADASYTVGDHHTVRGGMLAISDIEQLDTRLAVFSATSQFAPTPEGYQLPAPIPQSSFAPFAITANGGNRGVTAGIYLQDEWHLNELLILNYGVRYDRFDVSFDHEGQLSPRVNLVWRINDATSAHVGYARYFMPPTLQYLASSSSKLFEYSTDAPFNDRNDPPQVERDHYFDAGVSRQLTPSWQITADSFLKRARNLLDDGQFGTAVILNNFNYSSGTVYGSELSSIYRRGPFSAYGNFSYVQTRARNIDSVENEFPINELAFLSANSIQLDHQGRFTGSGGTSYTFTDDTQVHTDFLYGNGLRAGFANLEKLPPYTTANVGVEHVWYLHSPAVHQLKLRFDCLNVFDRIYAIRKALASASPLRPTDRGEPFMPVSMPFFDLRGERSRYSVTTVQIRIA
jgi:outer membrane receptor protein involved in Fe transport